MGKNAGLTENEKLLQQLQQDVKDSKKGFKSLQEQFKVYINKGADSEAFFDFAGIDQLESKVFTETNWPKKLSRFNEIKERLSHFERSYQQARDSLLSATIPTKQDEDNFEIATRQYHKFLEVLHNCLGNVVDALGHNGRLAKKTFQDRLDVSQKEHTLWNDEIKKFSDDLEDVSNKIADKQFKNPANKMTVNLRAAIENLSTTYDSSYDTYGKKSTFWRWIKDFFKQSDRAKEISFLQTVSASPGCTDTIRHQAMSLVRDKIKQNERFGKTSQLEKILTSLTASSLDVEKEDTSNLTAFLASNLSLKTAMPAKLSAYFEKNEEDYSKAYHAEEETMSPSC